MKLEGFRVVDLSMYLPGPVITQMMADHGAEVIRVEPPGGEPARRFGPFGRDGVSLWFKGTHRGKRSLELDLKSDAGRAAIRRLARDADVFIEGYRPGVAARLGIDAATLRGLNPRLVHCSISAYGQTGPLARRGSHDMGPQAFTGLLALNNEGDAPPVVPGVPAADIGSALTALSAILMALLRRERTGRGDSIDIAMYDSLLAWTPHLAGFVAAEGIAPSSTNQRSVGGAAFYNIYPTSDGRAIALTGRELHYAEALLMALERPDLLPLAAEDPGPRQRRLIGELRAIFAARSYAEWCGFLADVKVSWAPILDMVEAFDHPHMVAREMLVDAAGDRVPGTPIKFADEPARPPAAVPALNEAATLVAGESQSLIWTRRL